MSKQVKLATVVRISVLVAAMGLLTGCLEDDTKLSSSMPQQLNSRISMKPGERIRETIYVPGTNIKKEALITLSEGETAEYTYYSDGPARGRLRHAKIFFKAAEGEKRGPLKREIELAPDERTTLKDRVFYADGKLKRASELVSEKLSEAREFREDGATVTKFQRFSKHYSVWNLTREEAFYEDSSPQRILVLNDEQLAGTIDEFSKDHKLRAHSIVGPYGMRIVSELYLDDGVTPYRRITQTASVKVENLVDGAVTDEWRFYGNFGGLDYTRYAHGHPVLHQQWLIRDGKKANQEGKVTIGDYYLSLVETFDANGDLLKRYVLVKDSIVPNQIAERNEGAAPSKIAGYAPGKIRTFDADGLLRNEVVLDDKDKIVSQRDYNADDHVVAPAIPEELLQPPIFEAPPPALRNGESEDESGEDH